jgi:hypothetical protein
MGDGKVRDITENDLFYGTILRMVNDDGTYPPFADCYIVGTIVRLDRSICVNLVRPYNGGEEHFAFIYKGTLPSNYKVVLTDRGEPYKVSD